MSIFEHCLCESKPCKCCQLSNHLSIVPPLHEFDPDRTKLYDKYREKKVIVFDIDGTITHETEGWDYEKRTPRIDVIDRMHTLYNRGNVRIIVWTARHYVDTEITKKWLEKHNVPYHKLIMDKMYWDEYICDKSFNVEDWLSGKEI